MSRMRTGLKPMEPTRRTPTKFPPVRSGWKSNSPPLAGSAREPEWSHDMIRGVQLKTTTKRPLAASTSPRRTPTTDEIKTSPSLKQQDERKFSNPQENVKDKEIEVSHCRVENWCEIMIIEYCLSCFYEVRYHNSNILVKLKLQYHQPLQVYDILIFH